MLTRYLACLCSKLRNRWALCMCTVHSINKQNRRTLGSCVLKASVDRVSVDTIGRYSDRHWADRSTDTRPICRSSVGRHVVLVIRLSVDTIGRYVGRHSADISADMLWSTVASVSVDCRWGIGRLLTVVLLKYQQSPYQLFLSSFAPL